MLYIFEYFELLDSFQEGQEVFVYTNKNGDYQVINTEYLRWCDKIFDFKWTIE